MRTQIQRYHLSGVLVAAGFLAAAPAMAGVFGGLIPGAAQIWPADRFVPGDGTEALSGRSAAVEPTACAQDARPAAFDSAADRLVFGAEGLRCGGFVIRPTGTAGVFTP